MCVVKLELVCGMSSSGSSGGGDDNGWVHYELLTLLISLSSS